MLFVECFLRRILMIAGIIITDKAHGRIREGSGDSRDIFPVVSAPVYAMHPFEYYALLRTRRQSITPLF